MARIPIQQVVIRWSENQSFTQRFGQPVRLAGLREADLLLRGIAATAPAVGHDITACTVVWTDGTQYELRLALNRTRQPSLAKHLREALEQDAGQYRPRDWSRQQYRDYLNRQISREHASRCEELLQRYELEPPPLEHKPEE